MFTEVPHARAGEQESGPRELVCWGTTETHRGHLLPAFHHYQCFLAKNQTNTQKTPLSAGKEGAL